MKAIPVHILQVVGFSAGLWSDAAVPARDLLRRICVRRNSDGVRLHMERAQIHARPTPSHRCFSAALTLLQKEIANTITSPEEFRIGVLTGFQTRAAPSASYRGSGDLGGAAAPDCAVGSSFHLERFKKYCSHSA